METQHTDAAEIRGRVNVEASWQHGMLNVQLIRVAELVADSSLSQPFEIRAKISIGHSCKAADRCQVEIPVNTKVSFEVQALDHDKSLTVMILIHNTITRRQTVIGRASFIIESIVVKNEKNVMPSVEVKYPPNMRMGRRNTEPSLPPDHRMMMMKKPTEYINAHSLDGLTNYPWFASNLGRDEARNRIEQLPQGTFLVRPSEKGGYALTVMCNGAKHIRILERNGQFSLDEEKYFASIPELIDHYHRFSLETSFSELTMVLSDSFKEAEGKDSGKEVGDLKYCKVLHDYSATESNQLSLQVGDLITIISKAAEGRGWWRGWLNGKTGYFPCTYVTEL